MAEDVFKRRIYPLEAAGALFGILRNKESTSDVFRMLNAIDGPVQERNFQLFRATETGRRILSEKRNLCDALVDRNYLRGLSAGSLGRAYLEFIEREGLSPEGFQQEMQASGEDNSDLDEDRHRFLYRCRHTHDLLHVVTGYGRDFIGEIALLAFTYQQSKLRTFAVLSSFGLITAYRKYQGLPARAAVMEGHRIGKTERSLFFADWESLFEKPLEEVRREYGIEPPQFYLSFADEAEARDCVYRDILIKRRKNAMRRDRAA